MHAWSARMPFLLPINSHSLSFSTGFVLCKRYKSLRDKTPIFIVLKSRTRSFDHTKRKEMRPSPMETTTRAAAATAIHAVLHLAPPPATCGPHGCRWGASAPSVSSGDIQTYVIVLVLCFVICALALTFAVRYFLHSGSGQPPPPSHPPAPARGEAEQKSASEAAVPQLAAAALMVFSPEVDLAGMEAECAICLSEFVRGEEIMVLKSCRHGFHDQCIEKWLSSKSSCPTCRSSCVINCTEHDNGTAQCSENGGTTASLSHRATEQV